MTTLNTSTLRPGLLVSLKTTLRGNVSYRKNIIESEHLTDEGAREKWETERTVSDPVEFAAAKVARGKAGYAIRSVCAVTAFGLLCPESDAEVLAAKIEEARQIADEFNSTAKLCRLTVYAITGRVAADDVEAVKAISAEVRELLEDMQEGINKADTKTIRDAAAKAKELGAMLSPDAEARITIAIDVAREAAKQIKKSGEAAAIAIDEAAIRKITEIRTAFLDIDGEREMIAPAASNRALDFEPVPEIKPVQTQQRAPLESFDGSENYEILARRERRSAEV